MADDQVRADLVAALTKPARLPTDRADALGTPTTPSGCWPAGSCSRRPPRSSPRPASSVPAHRAGPDAAAGAGAGRCVGEAACWRPQPALKDRAMGDVLRWGGVGVGGGWVVGVGGGGLWWVGGVGCFFVGLGGGV